jgi:zinc transport system substrate-binding protein
LTKQTKKITAVLTLIFLSAALLTACAGGETPPGGSELKKPLIITTTDALFEITRDIAGDLAEVSCLIPPGIEAHDYEPTPGDVERVRAAALVIRNGLGMDNWLDKVTGTSGGLIILATEGLAPIVTAEGATDPHIWMSPKSALGICENVSGALLEFFKSDTKACETVTANSLAIGKRIEEVSAQYSERLGQFGVDTIVTSHDAFGYVARDYGIRQVPIENIYAEGEPSARQMAELIDFVRKNSVRVILSEFTFSSAVADTLARETGAQVRTVYTMEAAEDNLSYVTRLLGNLNAMCG